MTDRPELSFDGKGINGPDEYRTRLATFNHTSALVADADITRYGNLFAAAPDLLKEAIELCELVESMNMDASPMRRAITKARGL